MYTPILSRCQDISCKGLLMARKRYRTMDDFISHKKLGGWKAPKPERELSWSEIKALYTTALTLSGKLNRAGDDTREYYRSAYDLVENELHTACLS